MGRRTLLLVAALLVAALGTSLVFVYVSNVDSRARAGQSPVSILVAKEDLPAGTAVDAAMEAGSFVMSEVPASAAIPDALSDITPIADKVALSTIYAGEQIIERKFGEPGQVSTLPIPPDMVALTIQLADPAKVANFLAPASR